MARWSRKISKNNNARSRLRLAKLGLLLLFLPSALAQQILPRTEGNHNQTVGTNNGVTIQLNVTATPKVKRSLKIAAKKDLGDERGWLRVLTPAQEPTPKNSCGQFTSDPKSLTVLLGGGAAGGCDRDVCEILRDSNPGAETTDLLSVRRRGTSLIVSGVIFDNEGKVVVALKDNKPHVNKNNAFDWIRPDDHTLDVVNQNNQRVLHIRLINRTTVYIEGVFYDSKGSKLQIGKDKLVFSFPPQKRILNIQGFCGFQNGGAVYSF